MTAEWHDIKAGPPPEDGKYIVFCPWADPVNPLITTAWWSSEDRWSLLNPYWADAITHWTELPAPPGASK